MAEDTDLATAVAVEVAKQIPVKEAYDDAVAPGARQAGLIVEDIAKTLRLALAPIQITAALQDRLSQFLNRSVRRVPEERRVAPAPQILGPVIEGIRYEPEGTAISEMFSQLLSRSIDKERLGEAHPAFPAIIRQLSSDEARVLAQLQRFVASKINYKFMFTRDWDATELIWSEAKEIDPGEFPLQILDFPSNLFFYIDHLASLGLAENQGLKSTPLFARSGGLQTGSRYINRVYLSDLGRRFMRAVEG